jgi:hypothetical protein
LVKERVRTKSESCWVGVEKREMKAKLRVISTFNVFYVSSTEEARPLEKERKSKRPTRPREDI